MKLSRLKIISVIVVRGWNFLWLESDHGSSFFFQEF